MKRLIFILMILFINIAAAQDTCKVLFIGNSFTSQNDLPNIFHQLAQGAGKNVLIASHMPGGISVGDTAQGAAAHMNNPVVYNLIRSNDWDYLILQDNQGRFCLPYGQFSPSSLVIEGHLKIRDSLLYYHPCAHMIWYTGFGPKNGYPPYGNTGVALIDSIYQNYQFLNDTAHQIIAPIGAAFKRIINQFPNIDLWAGDGVHPSLHGTTLVADVIYSSLFKSSPILSNYNSGITNFEDSLLKAIGFETTIDSIHYTGLSNITPNVSQVGNVLFVNGFQNCQWFLNDLPMMINYCEAQITTNGLYYAQVSDSNGCSYLTLSEYYSVTASENKLSDKLNIYPNPAEDFLSIHNSLNFKQYVIKDMTGKVILIDHKKTLDISQLDSGVYIMTLENDNGFIHTKFIKR